MSVPDAEMLIRIAQALDTSVGALLGETQQEGTEPDTIKELAAKLELSTNNLPSAPSGTGKFFEPSFSSLAF